jgi:cytochrome c peroxidase
MWRGTCALVVVAGCWSDAPLVDGALTGPQLAQLRAEMKLPDLAPCSDAPRGTNCDAAARLGQDLFFEPALSSTGTVACVTCHDPKGWYIDTRTPDNVSFGVTKWTGRNSPSTIDLGLLSYLPPPDKQAFTWNGAYTSPGAVLELAITKPMGSSKDVVGNLIRTNAYYLTEYMNAFGAPGTQGDIFANAEIAVNAYLDQVSSGYSAFDSYIAGDDSALNDRAKRGFGVFVGRGTCIECHRGPALTDFDFHVTGVPQSGENVPATDNGRGDVTNDPLDAGAFLTPSLRNVARTAPYMHDGALPSLDKVIDFYRHGGGASNYTGAKDPRIQELDITDQDADDLVAFLQSLNGMPVPAELTVDRRPFVPTICVAGMAPCD